MKKFLEKSLVVVVYILLAAIGTVSVYRLLDYRSNKDFENKFGIREPKTAVEKLMAKAVVDACLAETEKDYKRFSYEAEKLEVLLQKMPYATDSERESRMVVAKKCADFHELAKSARDLNESQWYLASCLYP